MKKTWGELVMDALAETGRHVPGEWSTDYTDPTKLRPDWEIRHGICPASKLTATLKCKGSIDWACKKTDPTGDCELCSTEPG
jgi:hypothetical protein